jgi:thioredoxin-related protein
MVAEAETEEDLSRLHKSTQWPKDEDQTDICYDPIMRDLPRALLNRPHKENIMMKETASLMLAFLTFACTPNLKNASRESSVKNAIQLLAEKRKVEIDVSKVTFRETDSIQLPSDIEYPKLKKLVDAYLDINDMQIVDRGGKKSVEALSEYHKMWSTNIEEAQQKSAREGKPLLIKFTTNFCEACEDQDKMFFAEEKVFNLLRNFVLLEIKDDNITADAVNGNDTANILLAKKYNVSKGLGFPTIVLASSSQNEVIKGHYDSWDDYWATFTNFQKANAKL